MSDELKKIEDSISTTEKHLSETIDAFVTQAKQKTRKTSKKTLKIVGISVGVVVVAVLLSKDKAMTNQYLATIEDATNWKNKYDNLLKDYLRLNEDYLDVIDEYLDYIALRNVKTIAS